MKKRKTSWRDILFKMLSLEMDTRAGRANRFTSILLLILMAMVVIPSTFEIIGNFVLSFNDKEPIGVLSAGWTTFIVVGTFLSIAFCGWFLVYASTKFEKYK